MNIWQILEIEQTNDKKQIKRAYSKKLKTIDQKTDITGFQNLNSAYKQALSMVSSTTTQKPQESFDDIQPQPPNETQTTNYDITSSYSYENESYQMSHDQLPEREEIDPFTINSEKIFATLKRQLHNNLGENAHAKTLDARQ